MAVKLAMRIRKFTNVQHEGRCIVDITGQTGPIVFGLLGGVVSSENADLLAESLGIPIEREKWDYPHADDFIEKQAEKTASMKGRLFDV